MHLLPYIYQLHIIIYVNTIDVSETYTCTSCNIHVDHIKYKACNDYMKLHHVKTVFTVMVWDTGKRAETFICVYSDNVRHWHESTTLSVFAVMVWHIGMLAQTYSDNVRHWHESTNFYLCLQRWWVYANQSRRPLDNLVVFRTEKITSTAACAEIPLLYLLTHGMEWVLTIRMQPYPNGDVCIHWRM